MGLRETISPENLVFIKRVIEENARAIGSPLLTADQYKTMLKNKTFGQDFGAFFLSFKENEEEQKQKSLIPSNAVQYIREEYEIKTLNGILHVYQDGYYKAEPEGGFIERLADNLFVPTERNSRRKNEIIAQLKSESAVSPESMNKHPEHFICFRNGVYDAKERKLLPHSPEYRFTNGIPWDYDPAAVHPGECVERFFEDAGITGNGPGSRRFMLLAFIGLCMTQDTRLQKALFLKGLPNTGKSTVVRMIQNVVGPENYSSESLAAIAEDRFAAYSTFGKLLNCNPDLSTETEIDPARFKAMTGEDDVSVQRKYGDPFRARLYAKFLFCMNGYPVVLTRETSFFRRCMILKMNVVPERRDQELTQKLTAETPYLIGEAVKALEEYYSLTDRDMIETGESKALVELWQISGDSVSAFLQTDPFDGRGTILTAKFREAYEAFCLREGRTPLKSSQKLRESMELKGYYVKHYNFGDCYVNPRYTDDFKIQTDIVTPFDAAEAL